MFINLFRTTDDYKLFISPIEMLDVPTDVFEQRVRGWFRPAIPVPAFLEALSHAGATHHSAIIYDASAEEMEYFAALCGLETVIVR